MSSDLRRPPLRDAHERRGARFTDFGGWEMPVEFDSITDEHVAVREAAGKFDVSHMSQLRVTGPDATTLVQRLTTNDVSLLDVGDSQYAATTTEEGVMLDDVVTYRFPNERAGDADTPTYVVVANAGHDVETLDRFTTRRDEWDLDATVENRTDEYAMYAVQGPAAVDVVASETDYSLRSLSRFEADGATVAGVDCWVARTGYTGEDGFELLCPAEDAETLWAALDCQPCGLGARDTLRIEAGYLLSGQDFHPETNPRTPYEAGIGFVVKLDTEFVGRDALERQHAEGVEETFVGVRMVDRGVPRAGYDVLDADGTTLGTLTSGTKTPTLDWPVGLGYLPVEHADPGTNIRVRIRGDDRKAKVEALPFVDTV